jgi:ribosomal protein S18 acetylase RimI-like enzyme
VNELEIVQADLSDAEHAAAVVAMVDAYSRDPMGAGAPLRADVREALIPRLRAHPGTVVFLAMRAHEPVGVAVCFTGFSTFAARPLLNVHDLGVVGARRGEGVGRLLLEAAEAFARARGFCKLTLEVVEHNTRALGLYESFGFTSYQLDPSTGRAYMMQKKV